MQHYQIRYRSKSGYKPPNQIVVRSGDTLEIALHKLQSDNIAVPIEILEVRLITEPFPPCEFCRFLVGHHPVCANHPANLKYKEPAKCPECFVPLLDDKSAHWPWRSKTEANVLLRDKFAKVALDEYLCDLSYHKRDGLEKLDKSEAASWAYEMADAMMKERGK